MRNWNWKDTLGVLAIVLAGALLVAGGIVTSGCAGLFETTCTKLQPALSRGPTYLTDAGIWLDHAEEFESLLGPEKGGLLASLIDKGRVVLSGVAKSVDGLTTACSTDPNWLVVFADFIAVVKDIEKLISGLSATPGHQGVTLALPLVMQEGGR